MKFITKFFLGSIIATLVSCTSREIEVQRVQNEWYPTWDTTRFRIGFIDTLGNAVTDFKYFGASFCQNQTIFCSDSLKGYKIQLHDSRPQYIQAITEEDEYIKLREKISIDTINSGLDTSYCIHSKWLFTGTFSAGWLNEEFIITDWKNIYQYTGDKENYFYIKKVGCSSRDITADFGVLYYLHNNMAVIGKNGERLIDITRNKVLYDFGRNYFLPNDHKVVFRYQGKLAYYDILSRKIKYGKLQVAPNIDTISNCITQSGMFVRDRLLIVESQDNKLKNPLMRYRIYDQKLNLVEENKYDAIYFRSAETGIALVSKADTVGYTNQQGTWLWKTSFNKSRKGLEFPLYFNGTYCFLAFVRKM